MPVLVHTGICVCTPTDAHRALHSHTSLLLMDLAYIISKSQAPSGLQFCHLYNGALTAELKFLPAGRLLSLVPTHSCQY